jgi:hypothetical protein
MTVVYAKQLTLEAPAECELNISNPGIGGPITAILRFQIDEALSRWMESEDYETFKHQALEQNVDHIVLVTPQEVGGYHRIQPRRPIGWRSKTSQPEPRYVAF